MRKVILFLSALTVFFLAVIIALVIVYYPRTASERLYYCVWGEMDEMQYDASDKKDVLATVTKILEEPCGKKFQEYKEMFEKKDKIRNQFSNVSEAQIHEEARKEALAEFTPEKAAEHYLEIFYMP